MNRVSIIMVILIVLVIGITFALSSAYSPALAYSSDGIYDSSDTLLQSNSSYNTYNNNVLTSDYWTNWCSQNYTFGFDIFDDSIDLSYDQPLHDSGVLFNSRLTIPDVYENNSVNALSEVITFDDFAILDDGTNYLQYQILSIGSIGVFGNYTSVEVDRKLFYDYTIDGVTTSGVLDFTMYFDNYSDDETYYFYTSTYDPPPYGTYNQETILMSDDRGAIIIEIMDGRDDSLSGSDRYGSLRGSFAVLSNIKGDLEINIYGITPGYYGSLECPPFKFNYNLDLVEGNSYLFSDYLDYFEGASTNYSFYSYVFNYRISIGDPDSGIVHMSDPIRKEYSFNLDYLYFIPVREFTVESGISYSSSGAYYHVLLYYKYPIDSITEQFRITDFFSMSEIKDIYLSYPDSRPIVYASVYSNNHNNSYCYLPYQDIRMTLDISYPLCPYQYFLCSGSSVRNCYYFNNLVVEETLEETFSDHEDYLYTLPDDYSFRVKSCNIRGTKANYFFETTFAVNFSYAEDYTSNSSGNISFKYDGDLMTPKEIPDDLGWERLSARLYNAVADFVNTTFIKNLYVGTVGVYNWFKSFFTEYSTMFTGFGILSTFIVGALAVLLLYRLGG